MTWRLSKCKRWRLSSNGEVRCTDLGCDEITWWLPKCRCGRAASVSARRRRPEGSWYTEAMTAGGAAASTACSLSTASRRCCSMSWETAVPPPSACAPVPSRASAMPCPGAAAHDRISPVSLAACFTQRQYRQKKIAPNTPCHILWPLMNRDKQGNPCNWSDLSTPDTGVSEAGSCDGGHFADQETRQPLICIWKFTKVRTR